jgi:hypothetical protein
MGRTVEIAHDLVYPQKPPRNDLERMVAGALKSAIDAHGPITRTNLSSAAKRVVGLFQSPDGRLGCPYCRERLRINVGLVAEVSEQKKRLQSALTQHEPEASEGRPTPPSGTAQSSSTA